MDPQIYFKSNGYIKSFAQHNQQKKNQEVDWDAHYDGDLANIKIDINDNGEKKYFDFDLDKKDIEEAMHLPIMRSPRYTRRQMSPQIMMVGAPMERTSRPLENYKIVAIPKRRVYYSKRRQPRRYYYKSHRRHRHHHRRPKTIRIYT